MLFDFSNLNLTTLIVFGKYKSNRKRTNKGNFNELSDVGKFSIVFFSVIHPPLAKENLKGLMNSYSLRFSYFS